jgi:NAD(P)H-flavin reductase
VQPYHAVPLQLQTAKIASVHTIDGSGFTRIEVQYENDPTKPGSKKFQLLHHEAGQYALICIPSINSWQWHPITISSAPHKVDAFSFHIKTGVASDCWSKKVAQLTPGAKIRYVFIH